MKNGIQKSNIKTREAHTFYTNYDDVFNCDIEG